MFRSLLAASSQVNSRSSLGRQSSLNFSVRGGKSRRAKALYADISRQSSRVDSDWATSSLKRRGNGSGSGKTSDYANRTLTTATQRGHTLRPGDKKLSPPPGARSEGRVSFQGSVAAEDTVRSHATSSGSAGQRVPVAALAGWWEGEKIGRLAKHPDVDDVSSNRKNHYYYQTSFNH